MTTGLGLTSIRTSEGKLEIVNQLLLPHTVEFIEIKSIDDAYDAIKSMKVPSPSCSYIGAAAIAHRLLHHRSAAPQRSHPWLRWP